MNEVLKDVLKEVNNDFDKSFLPNNVIEEVIKVAQTEFLANLIEIDGNMELINRSIEAVEQEFPDLTEEEERRILEFAIDQVDGKQSPKEVLQKYGRPIALIANVLRKVSEVKRLKQANDYTVGKVNKLKELIHVGE